MEAEDIVLKQSTYLIREVIILEVRTAVVIVILD
jgi:hypothetical protein